MNANNDNNMRTDDELLSQFFNDTRRELADNGFSTRVIRQLPRRARRLDRIWSAVYFVAAAVIFVLFDGMAEVRLLASKLLDDGAQLLATMNPTGLSPMTVVAALAILASVWAYNVLSTQR